MRDSIEVTGNVKGVEKREVISETQPSVVQISFSLKADMDLVRKQLEAIRDTESKTTGFICGFLHRKHVMEMEFDLTVVEMLEEILGSRLLFVSEQFNTYGLAMANMSNIRSYISGVASMTYVLGLKGLSDGVSNEVGLASNDKVLLVPSGE